MPNRRKIFVSAVCLSMAVFTVRTLSQTDNPNQPARLPYAEDLESGSKVADSLNVRWRSITYEKRLYNPAHTSNTQGQPKADSLSLSCEVDMPEPELVLGTCNDSVIGQITDSQGGDVEIGNVPSRSTPMYRLNQRFNRGFMPAGRPRGPEHSTFKVELDAGLRKRISGEIVLKGHFYALIAESIDYVDLPFEPNDKWVSITPGVEVRVREARNDASMYKFDIEQRPENAPNLIFMRIGDFLPSRLVVDRQIIVQRSAAGFVGGGGGGIIGGTGSGIGRAEKIRYTIAVNPAHQTIPFKLEQIPLSLLAEPVPSQKRGSNQPESAHVRRQMQNITRRGTRSAAQSMPEQVRAQFNEKVAKCFEVNWISITYSKTLYNPVVSTNSKEQGVSEKLSVRCEAEILDPKLIVGTCNIPIIEQITDGKGRDTDISRAQPYSIRMFYRSLQYRPSLIPTLPSALIQWEGKARTALGLPLLARHRPKRGPELQPVRLSIQLDPGLLRQDPVEIGCIKGYFHALTAESVKHVEVPFKPDNKWVRLTSEVEIQVNKAWHIGTAARFDIRQRWRTGGSAHRLFVGDSLPDGIVVERQFIGKSSWREMPFKLGRSLPVPIGGSGSHNVGQRIENIDYLIATSPNHNRIPFEIEHIPLPKP